MWLGEVPRGEWHTRTVGFASWCKDCKGQREMLTIARRDSHRLDTYYFCQNCDVSSENAPRARSW